MEPSTSKTGDSSPPNPFLGVPKWLAWARLARISNLPSAIANILVGFLLVNQGWQPWIALLMLVFASSFLYCAGMILNDYFDREIDSQLSPSRPLVSGQIQPGLALKVACILILLGIVVSSVAAVIYGNLVTTFCIATLLAICIYLYDGWLKSTFIAPFIMGTCRTLNILLGASIAANPRLVEPTISTFGIHHIAWWVAGAIGIYVAGITLFARDEHRVSLQAKLLAGLALMVTGIIGLASLPFVFEYAKSLDRIQLNGFFTALVLLVSITIFRSGLVAIWSPKPAYVKSTIITSLRSLIIFDASVALLFCGGVLAYPITIICLIGVVLMLGARIKST